MLYSNHCFENCYNRNYIRTVFTTRFMVQDAGFQRVPAIFGCATVYPFAASQFSSQWMLYSPF